MAHRVIPLSGRRITFDTEIIETLYTSLRQIITIGGKSSKGCHTHTRMDDVDYLVEDNAMDDFCLSPEMDGTHGRTTYADNSDQ